MKILKGITLLPIFSLFLAACAAQAFPEVSSVNNGESANSADQVASDPGTAWMDGQARQDEQGAVTVVVTPLTLTSGSETLDFDIAMDTHSVNLDMDLGTLSTLTTDTGLSVDNSTWTTAESGHHVSGVLSFSATLNGVSILEGASRIMLTIRGVDAAERVFSWQQ